MPACNKDAFINDIVIEADEAQIAHIESAYPVNVHAQSHGGDSHTEKRHGHNVTREYLQSRIAARPGIPATKFNSREDMWSSRHRWLEAFSPRMRQVSDHYPNGALFVRTLGVGETIGSGVSPSGKNIDGIKNVTFVFKWDAVQGKWFERSGYPEARHDFTHKTWKHQ